MQQTYGHWSYREVINVSLNNWDSGHTGNGRVEQKAYGAMSIWGNGRVTDLLIQRGPSADSVTRPVEALSQRVSSRLPSLLLFCQAYASMQLLYSK